jgi:murein DD-endopeptidase MepM/ murein hydrolase activator NlpD
MGFLDEIEQLAEFFGLSVSDKDIEDPSFNEDEFLNTKKEQPKKQEQTSSSQPIVSGTQYTRVKNDVSKSLQQMSYDFLKQLRGKPYGSFLPFEYGGKKYKAVLEEHIGGSHVSGKHPGISLFIEKDLFIDKGNKVQFGDETFSKIESKKYQNNFRIPSTGAFVSSFGVVTPTHPDGHKGIDIGSNIGEPVYAIGPGYVKSITSERSNPKGGNTVTTVHKDGEVESYYAHLNSVNVRVGQKVDSNTVIGTIGDSGMIYNGKRRKTAPHLHWELRMNGRQVNPMDIMKI